MPSVHSNGYEATNIPLVNINGTCIVTPCRSTLPVHWRFRNRSSASRTPNAHRRPTEQQSRRQNGECGEVGWGECVLSARYVAARAGGFGGLMQVQCGRVYTPYRVCSPHSRAVCVRGYMPDACEVKLKINSNLRSQSERRLQWMCVCGHESLSSQAFRWVCSFICSWKYDYYYVYFKHLLCAIVITATKGRHRYNISRVERRRSVASAMSLRLPITHDTRHTQPPYQTTTNTTQMLFTDTP